MGSNSPETRKSLQYDSEWARHCSWRQAGCESLPIEYPLRCSQSHGLAHHSCAHSLCCTLPCFPAKEEAATATLLSSAAHFLYRSLALWGSCAYFWSAPCTGESCWWTFNWAGDRLCPLRWHCFPLLLQFAACWGKYHLLRSYFFASCGLYEADQFAWRSLTT